MVCENHGVFGTFWVSELHTSEQTTSEIVWYPYDFPITTHNPVIIRLLLVYRDTKPVIPELTGIRIHQYFVP